MRHHDTRLNGCVRRLRAMGIPITGRRQQQKKTGDQKLNQLIRMVKNQHHNHK